MKNSIKPKFSALLGFTVLTVILLSLSSCMSMMAGMVKSMYKDHGVYDKTVPADQLVDFRFVGVNIRSFNGQQVSWGDKANNVGHIKLPPGTHNFVFDFVQEKTQMTDYSHNSYTGVSTWTYTTTTTRLNNLTIPQIIFLPGHKYSLAGGLINDEVVLFMQDVTNSPSRLFGDEVANAPKASRTPTELEGTWKTADGTVFKFAGNTWEMEIPQGSYMGTPATPPEGAIAKGTFVIEGNRFTTYFTHQGLKGSRLFDISALGQAAIYTYSFEGGNLMLEVEFLYPKMAFVKQ